MDLMIRWSTTVWRTLATDDRDKELETNWEFMVLREYRMGDRHEDVARSTWSL